MNADYCGFADWAPCGDLATTGGETGFLILVAVAAVALIVIGVVSSIRGRR